MFPDLMNDLDDIHIEVLEPTDLDEPLFLQDTGDLLFGYVSTEYALIRSPSIIIGKMIQEELDRS